MNPKTTLRGVLTAFVVLALGPAACQGSDPAPLEPLDSDPFFARGAVLAGGGPNPLVAYGHQDGAGGVLFRVLRHDAAASNGVTEVVSVTLPWISFLDAVAVSSTRVAVEFNTDVVLLDATGSGHIASIPVSRTPQVLALEARWVLVASGPELELVDADAQAGRATFTATTDVSGVVALTGGFLAFTAGGFVYVDVTGDVPRFEEHAAADVRGLRAAYADGSDVIAAGPADAPGVSRVVRLDVSSPTHPTLRHALELSGEYDGFAWDGGDTSVLARRAADANWTSDGFVIRERDGRFSASGVPLPTFLSLGPPHLAAHAGVLFDLCDDGMQVFRIR